jgi:hypothetical protein
MSVVVKIDLDYFYCFLYCLYLLQRSWTLLGDRNRLVINIPIKGHGSNKAILYVHNSQSYIKIIIIKYMGSFEIYLLAVLDM